MCIIEPSYKYLIGSVFPIGENKYFFAIFLYNKSDVRDPRHGYFIMEHLVFINIIFKCNHVISSTSTKFYFSIFQD